MRIEEKTDTRLVLTDSQMDKAVGIGALCVFAIGVAALFAWEGFWTPVVVLLVVVPCALLYLKMTRLKATLVFDRLDDRIDLSAKSRKGQETWTWRFSDLETAEISQRGRENISDGVKRPNLVMKDGTRVPMRPYHAAGTQSWHAVAAVKLFLGQRLEDAPVGWIPPEEFDRFFADEMSRLYK